MKDLILNLFASKPKQYIQEIKRTPELMEWVNSNTLTKSTHLPARVYSAVHQVTDQCELGNTKKFDRFSTGFTGCGPAGVCECTKKQIAAAVSKTKLDYSEKKLTEVNDKRQQTMINRYGVAYNSQRSDIKHIWTKNKVSNEVYSKLTNKLWLDNEYNIKRRPLTDIAEELGVYYSTVGEYCRKFNFKIRQQTNHSIQETQILDYIQSLGVECVHSDWTVLGNKEIDIYIPLAKLGIEVNGLFWHSYHPVIGKFEHRTKHIEKTHNAAASGVKLIHVTDYEWKHKNSIIKSIIRTNLGLNTKIPARSCIVKTIDKMQEKEFLNAHHLQGYIPSDSATGLYYNNELVMLMSVGKTRFNKTADYELLRMCSRDGITVVGGVSKLISYIKLAYPKSTIVSYCDLAKSDGRGYLKAGFQQIESTGPGYCWTDGNTVISRYRCQRKQLQKWLLSYNSNKSESKNMFDAKYRRLWDCGNAVFILNT